MMRDIGGVHFKMVCPIRPRPCSRCGEYGTGACGCSSSSGESQSSNLDDVVCAIISLGALSIFGATIYVMDRAIIALNKLEMFYTRNDANWLPWVVGAGAGLVSYAAGMTIKNYGENSERERLSKKSITTEVLR